MPLRLIFMGTPDFAVPALSEILGAGHDIVAVYCQPPRPAGRGMAERPSAVEALARASGLDVRSPKSLRTEEVQSEIRALAADAGVVVAYGLLLPAAVLAATREGFLNLHPSALPRWRGAAPLQRTLMAGDVESAVEVMRMDEGLDTGPVCLAERVPLPPDMTAGEWHDLAARRGADLLVRALAALERGSLDCRPQAADGVTYAKKIDKAEARIDWQLSALDVHNRIRGLSPFPGAWFELPGDFAERVKVLRSRVVEGRGPAGCLLDDQLTVACGTGAVRLVEVQRAGKKPAAGREVFRGLRLPIGTHLK